MKHSWLIDPSKCTGCRTCEVVCSLYHENEVNPSKSRIKVVKWEDKGMDVPVVCQHCEIPLCMEHCPSGALYKEGKHNVVCYRKELCIGCKLCLLVCPCGGIGLSNEGFILKCDLCGGNPYCTEFCLPKAIEFVPNPQVHERQKRTAARVLLHKLGRMETESGQPLRNQS